MNVFLAWFISLVVIIISGIFLIYGICSVRKNALKSDVFVGVGGMMLVFLSVFKQDPPKNDRRIELVGRSKKNFDEKN